MWTILLNYTLKNKVFIQIYTTLTFNYEAKKNN